MLTINPAESLLARITADWTAHGWLPEHLRSFRMEDVGGDDGDKGKGDGGDGGGADDKGSDGDGDKGKGDAGGQDDKTDWKAEAEKWKTQSRKHEDRAKANSGAAKELDELKRSQMDDQQKAVAAAKDEGRAEALSTVGAKLVDAEIRATSAGRLSDDQRAALLEGLDRSKFLTDDGDVDTDKVTKLIDGIAPQSDTDDKNGNGRNGHGKPDMGQGRRSGGAQPSVTSGRDLYQERHPAKK